FCNDMFLSYFCVFFFQAEDGIRDRNVTGVQTCALPIYAHPFQLYNPETFAYHGGKTGTTTLINDNIRFLSLLDREKAFELINDFHKLPISMFWWGRFDS